MIEYTVKVYHNGSTHWCINDDLHREGDKPAVEYASGDKAWYLNGDLHREGDKPAIEYASGAKSWYINGKCHRENGAAVIYANGTKEWYLNGEHLTEEEHAARTQPTKELTVADIEKLLGHKVKVIK